MDYYKTLGVERNASPDEIKKAYRKMAAKHHPDRGGNKEEFQKVEEAYRNLSDPHLKQQHDNPHPFGGGGDPFGGGFHFNFGGGNPFDDFFRQFHQQQQRVYTVAIAVTLEQVANGETIPVQFGTPHGPKTFQITVPLAIQHGQQVRYEGLMPDGIVQIEFRILPHQRFERRNLDLHCTEKVDIFDFITGTTRRIKTIYGEELDLTIPPRSTPGISMRIAGKGLRSKFGSGNQIVLLQAQIPDTISDELLALIEKERTK
jgi:curved DNA-binding protein